MDYLDYLDYMRTHPHTISIENKSGIIIWKKQVVSESINTCEYEIDVVNQIARFKFFSIAKK